MPTVPPLAMATGGNKGVHHPKDLHDDRALIGKRIVVDIYESLWDSEHSSGAGPGEYDVQVSGVEAWRFKITPGDSKEERAAGALVVLPVNVRPPIRVRGIAAPTTFGVRLVAHTIEQLSFPSPKRIPSAEVLTKDPKTWHGQYVEVEDEWSTAFEASFIGTGGTWLDAYPSVTVKCEPPPPKKPLEHLGLNVTTRRVHVIGFVYTATGSYGHLGMARANLVATFITYIDPKRPECR